MLDVLFPPLCMLCGMPGGGLCEACADQLEQPSAADPPAGIDSIYGICSYEGAGRRLVLALKRGNRRDGIPVLGASLAEAISKDHPVALRRSANQYASCAGSAPVGTAGPHEPRLAGVTWAPTTTQRRRRRGYDQSQLLATAVARALGLRARRCLERTGAAQMGLDVAHRRVNPAFSAAGPAAHPGPDGLGGTWVLVDDVVTTGATMSAAATALRAAGARSVIGATIAYTP